MIVKVERACLVGCSGQVLMLIIVYLNACSDYNLCCILTKTFCFAADSIFFKNDLLILGVTIKQVPFEEVSELVASRRIFLQRGHAFVPMSQLAALVVGQFRSRLSKALVLTNRIQ
eukprot:Gb_25311 [translate_table: standard]